MPARPTRPPGWYVISLRPRGEHEGLRRAAARHGAGLIALSPWRLRRHADAATASELAAALAAPVAVFTSPVAVRAAAALQALDAGAQRLRIGVGAGTAAALRRAGVRGALAPERMDSDGLLALAPLARDAIASRDVGLVTAPGGRGLIEPALTARGARVRRVDVYTREPVAPAPTAVAALCAVRAPLALALSSGEALEHVLGCLPAPALARLRTAQVLAASERLAALARAHGFGDIVQARGPRPGDLVAAAREARNPH